MPPSTPTGALYPVDPGVAADVPPGTPSGGLYPVGAGAAGEVPPVTPIMGGLYPLDSSLGAPHTPPSEQPTTPRAAGPLLPRVGLAPPRSTTPARSARKARGGWGRAPVRAPRYASPVLA